MKKLSKRVLSLILAIIMLASLGTVMLTANAADSITVYFNNTADWSTVNAYYWSSATNSGPLSWPGTAMMSVGDGVYSISVPSGNDMIIFNNSSAQTDDLTIGGDNYIYDYSTGAWSIYDTSSVTPVISASKKNGASFKTDTVDVTFTVQYADSAKYSVDGGTAKSFTDSVTVTLGSGVAVNSTTSVTVTATNENGTTTETYTYTKKEASASGDNGATSAALDGYFGTNPDGQVGKKASITIDGSISDWDSSMLIAQGVANDDPRVYRPNSMYEIGMDDYALYAAWDDDNLYLMWEMANVQDAVAPLDTYPISQGNHWINNMPVFLYFSIDPSIQGDGTVTSGATVWDSGITFDTYVDTVVAFSTNNSNGPFVYKANDDGKIVYNDTYQSSIKLDWGNDTISTELWGIDEGYGEYNNRIPGDVLDSSSNWIDFYQDPEHSKSIDMFYEMSIPLDLLGISASELTSNGIGVMKISTFGTSGMNSLPADPSMWDNAALPYTEQEPNSHEKEDADNITVPLARIGKLESTSITETPTTSGGTTETPTSTGTEYILGDADANGEVNIMDATEIQMFLAKKVDAIDEDAADVDVDSTVTILDATEIQKFLAQIGNPYNIGTTLIK